MVDQGVTDPSPRPAAFKLAAGMTLLVGALSASLGSAHLYGVSVTANLKGYTYDFRLAALYIVGMAIVAGGVLCLVAVRALASANRMGLERGIYGTVLLLVCIPLRPIQPELAGGLTTVGIVNLIVLLGVALATRHEAGRGSVR